MTKEEIRWMSGVLGCLIGELQSVVANAFKDLKFQMRLHPCLKIPGREHVFLGFTHTSKISL